MCKVCFYQPPHLDPATERLRQFITSSIKYGVTGRRDASLSVRLSLLTDPPPAIPVPKAGFQKGASSSTIGNEGSDCGTLHFLLFETHRMEAALSLVIREGLLDSSLGGISGSAAPDEGYRQDADVMLEARDTLNGASIASVAVTGGGANKFGPLFKNAPRSVRFVPFDEFRCLVLGQHYLLKNVSDECYFYKDPMSSQQITCKDLRQSLSSFYPYILCNVGTGVSILKVTGPQSYERVSGSGLGGDTYWGLCRLLTSGRIPSFPASLEASTHGKAENVDMTVGCERREMITYSTF